MTELWRLSACALAGAIRDRKVTSREVLEAHLERIAATNPALNAVCVVLADSSIAAAEEADRALATGKPLGPLHGVPFTVKENIDLVGTSITHGVNALAQAVSPGDAPVVERMKQAGAIPIGRTNMPDFALRVSTNSQLRGLTKNPWSPLHTAGGSSGGEASALAVGMSPIGLGNDVGGSLRAPAFCCGVSSIRPTLGRIPSASYLKPVDPSLAYQMFHVEGPMARRVSDVRLGLQILAGRHPRDPRSITVPFADTAPAKRVLLIPEVPGGTTHPALAATVRQAGEALRDAGYDVYEGEAPHVLDIVLAWVELFGASVIDVFDELEPMMNRDARAILANGFGLLPPATAKSLLAVVARIHSFQRAWGEFMVDMPLVLTSTWSSLPFLHEADVPGHAHEISTLDVIRPVLIANALGLPAVAVPTGTHQGIPVGVQVIGDRYRENTCLDAAEAIEQRLGLETPIDLIGYL
jgi:amidase